ncbi:hypothetical protein BDV12DRAFT_202490 [Aspergillus spectabilis]
MVLGGSTIASFGGRKGCGVAFLSIPCDIPVDLKSRNLFPRVDTGEHLHHPPLSVGAMGCAASRDTRPAGTQMTPGEQWQQQPQLSPAAIDPGDSRFDPSSVEPNSADATVPISAIGYAASRETRQPGFQMTVEKQWQQPPQFAPAAINPADSRVHPSSVDPTSIHGACRTEHIIKPTGAATSSAFLMNSVNGFASAPSERPAPAALPALNFMNLGSMGPPSVLPVESLRTSSNPTPQIYLGTATIRAYGCDRDLINAYYVYIHPYLPLLPPPAISQYTDNPTEVTPLSSEADRSALSFWPTSPLSLALSALLVLIPLPKEPDPLSEHATVLRRSYAQLYLQSCEQSLEHSAERRQFNMTSYASTYTFQQPSPLHPNLPANLEPILALLLLTVYDYCQRGSRKHMRSRAHQALTAAMDISLHAMGVEAAEAQKRAWWMSMYLASQSSISNNSAPIMLMHDARITTPYPEFRSYHEPWELLIESQHALMQAGGIAKQLAKNRNNTSLPKTMADEIRRLDSMALALGAKLDDSECVMNHEGAEASAARNLWAFALLFVHTARIKLHRFIAFGDYPPLQHKPSDAKTTNLSNFTSSPTTYPPQPWTLETNSSFCSTAQKATEICLGSALVLSRILRHLPFPNPDPTEKRSTVNLTTPLPRSLPYLTCCTMQSCYVLVMLIRRLRASLYTRDFSAWHYLLRSSTPGTEVQDVERAIEELQNGIGALYTALRCDSVFEGIGDMVRDVEAVYLENSASMDGATAPSSYIT